MLYVTAVEPLTYFLAIVFPEARVQLANGTSIFFLRYAGWLCVSYCWVLSWFREMMVNPDLGQTTSIWRQVHIVTMLKSLSRYNRSQTCPVLLILLTNLPRGKFKKPQDTLTVLVANQLMIVFGIAAIFYTGAAKAILFILGCLAGSLVFKTALYTFLNASASFPEHAKPTLWIAACCFFAGWLVFPVMWLVGPEGYGTVEFGISQMVHALADLVSKNTFGFASWYLRFKIIKKWEQEQKRLKREAEEKAKDASERAMIDPAFDLAYNGGYGPQYDVQPETQLVIRRTPATIAACTSLLDRARKFVEEREVRVLVVEEDGMNQKNILDAFKDVAECAVKADVLFSIEDVPRIFERGVPHYAAIFINADLLKHLVSLTPETVAEMELDIYSAADFRDEHKEMRRTKRRAIRKIRKLRDARSDAAGHRDDEDEEDDDYLYDSEEDARAAVEDSDELHATQRLFGARCIIAYRLGKGRKKISKEDKARLGFNVFLRHPTDSITLSRVFSKLSTQVGVVPMEMAEDDVLDFVLGTIEATALAASNDQYDPYRGVYGAPTAGGYQDVAGSHAGNASGGGYGPGAMIAVPRQSSSMDTLGAAFHSGYDEDATTVAARPVRASPRRQPVPQSTMHSSAASAGIRPVHEKPSSVSSAAGMSPPPPGARVGSARRMPAPVQERQGSFGREMSTALDHYDEAGASSIEDIRDTPRSARAAKAGGRSRRR